MSVQEPMLLEGPLSERVYVVTSYKVIDAEKGLHESRKKYDVTEQFEALAATRAERAVQTMHAEQAS